MEWDRLVEERNQWVAHNFPDHKLPPPLESCLGMIEELGELAHSHLKELQQIRGTEDEHRVNAQDAIGDATVYLWGVLSYLDYLPTDDRYFGDTFGDVAHEHLFGAFETAGQLCMIVRDPRVRFRTYALIDQLVFHLESYCTARDWDYDQIVTETWDKVKQRDWKKDPHAGGETPVGGGYKEGPDTNVIGDE